MWKGLRECKNYGLWTMQALRVSQYRPSNGPIKIDDEAGCCVFPLPLDTTLSPSSGVHLGALNSSPWPLDTLCYSQAVMHQNASLYHVNSQGFHVFSPPDLLPQKQSSEGPFSSYQKSMGDKQR